MSQKQSFLFFQEVYNLMEEIEDANLQPKLRVFLDAIRRFEIALKAIPNGQLAEKISLENDNRNRAFALICEQADVLSADGDKLGEKIASILSAYDEISQLPDEEKNGRFNKLIGELENCMPGDVPIEVADSISLLKRSNLAYRQYMEAYRMDLTGKCVTSETLRTRKETERVYEGVVEFVNAMLVYLGDRGYTDLIDRINDLIYSNIAEEEEIGQVAYA